MSPVQLPAPAHPQGRRGAISVPEGQALVDYTQQQIKAQASLRASTSCEAHTQQEQQAQAGAEAPEGYRS